MGPDKSLVCYDSDFSMAPSQNVIQEEAHSSPADKQQPMGLAQRLRDSGIARGTVS